MTLQPSSKPIVSFTNVQKSYDGQRLVVRDLNLDVYPGEFLSLLGPSGSGKTTCLMMLAGFEYPTDGEIRYEDTLLNELPPHKRNLGMVFQNYALFPHMSVGANLEYPLRVRRQPAGERKARVRRALEMVRMEGLWDRLPAQLSGGQQQRVALARALIFEPKVVLMDEPLGALDKQLREHMQLELKSLHQQLGITFIYVTHDQSEALTMSDRVAVFNHGIIQQVDTAEHLYESPVNRFVSGFVGDSNQFEAVVREAHGEFCLIEARDGTRLKGLNVNSLAAGDSCVGSMRPERIGFGLADDDAQHVPCNRFAVDIENHVYFGDHVRLHCRGLGLDSLAVRMQVSEGAPGGRGRATLVVDPEHVRVFAA